MVLNNLKLTHLFLLGVETDKAQDFYENLLCVSVHDFTEQYILFDVENCVLAIRQEQVLGMPITSSEFSVFQTSQNLEICMANLRARGVSFYEAIPQESAGHVAWFSDPYGHLHCLWESAPRHEVSIIPHSSVSQDPRIAYYFMAVDDLEIAIPFYRDVLGLPFIEAREGLYALFNAGGIILGLRQGKDAGAGVDAESWTVFETSRCEEFYGELERFGALPLGIRSEPHGKVYWFRAPGGHIQCFHDPEPDYALDNILNGRRYLLERLLSTAQAR